MSCWDEGTREHAGQLAVGPKAAAQLLIKQQQGKSGSFTVVDLWASQYFFQSQSMCSLIWSLVASTAAVVLPTALATVSAANNQLGTNVGANVFGYYLLKSASQLHTNEN